MIRIQKLVSPAAWNSTADKYGDSTLSEIPLPIEAAKLFARLLACAVMGYLLTKAVLTFCVTGC